MNEIKTGGTSLYFVIKVKAQSAKKNKKNLEERGDGFSL